MQTDSTISLANTSVPLHNYIFFFVVGLFKISVSNILCCCYSVAKSCLTLRDATDCSTSGSSVFRCLPEFAQIHVHCVGDATHHLILCCPLLLLPSVFPSESAVRIRWPKYWSFSNSPSSEYSGLIYFRIDWFNLLASTGLSKSLLQHHK